MVEPTVIYQDSDIVVLNKPPGLLVHAVSFHEDRPFGAGNARGERQRQQDGPRGGEFTLADWLLDTFPQVEGVGEQGRWGIIHRLDRETSGVMVVAFSQAAYVRLKKQFARREVQKTYRAFVYGNVREDRGVVERAIGRSATGNRSARIPPEEEDEGREARTTFKTLMRHTDASYLELYPKTGRTHQIRVHLSLLQHPVVCDRRYAPSRPAILGFERLALHSYKIAFTHPTTGSEVFFESPLPHDFVEAGRQIKDQ